MNPIGEYRELGDGDHVKELGPDGSSSGIAGLLGREVAGGRLIRECREAVRGCALSLVRQVFYEIKIYRSYPVKENPNSFRTRHMIAVGAARTLSHRHHYWHLTPKERGMVEFVIEAPYSKKPA